MNLSILRTAVTVSLLSAVVSLSIFSNHADAHNHGKHSMESDIVETAAKAGQFETLLAAAKAANLVDALKGDGPLTVFAPTDDAFGALPAGTVDALLKPENRDQLAAILKYHVIPGRIGSEALDDNVGLETLAGPDAIIKAAEKGFTIEGARILTTDIDASNGVVHVIDRVIMPPEQMSRASALMIERAIAKGAPMFNHGRAHDTVDIYMSTAKQLMGSAPMTGAERNRLMDALVRSDEMTDVREQAWQLRYALDDVGRSLMARR